MTHRSENKDQQFRDERKERGEDPDKPKPETPAEIAEKRYTIGEKLRILRKVGWRVTLHVGTEYAVDSVKELLFGG